jgi:phage portal protein BeeE
MSRPSGTLTTPEFLTDDKAEIYKKRWDENYGPGKQGRTAILGNGLKYEALTQTAEDSQLVEQLKMSAEMICSTFHVPGWKVGVGARPAYQNASLEQQSYYNDAVQTQMQGIESLLTEGLGVDRVSDKTYRVDLDEDVLLRMDEGALTTVLAEQVKGGLAMPDENRKRLNLPPVPGGNTVYLQQQNYSLAALAKRDASDDPFGTAKPAAAAPSLPTAPESEKDLGVVLQRMADDLTTKQGQLFSELDSRIQEREAKRAAEAREAEQRALEIQSQAEKEAEALATALILRFSDAQSLA